MSIGFSKGAWLMAGGAGCFSLGSALVKLAGLGLPTMEILFFRSLVGFGFCLFLLRRSGARGFGRNKPLLALRAVLGFLAHFLAFYGFVHLPLADASILYFLHPAFVVAAARVFLNERMGPKGGLLVLAALCGAVAAVRPSFLFSGRYELDPLGAGAAVAGAVVTALAIVCIRKLVKTEHPAVVMTYPMGFSLILCPLSAGDWIWPNGVEWAFLAGLGLAMALGQYLMTRGYSLETAARISSIGYLEIVFAVMWGFILFAEKPDLVTLAGGGTIVLSALLLGSRRSGK